MVHAVEKSDVEAKDLSQTWLRPASDQDDMSTAKRKSHSLPETNKRDKPIQSTGMLKLFPPGERSS